MSSDDWSPSVTRNAVENRGPLEEKYVAKHERASAKHWKNKKLWKISGSRITPKTEERARPVLPCGSSVSDAFWALLWLRRVSARSIYEHYWGTTGLLLGLLEPPKCESVKLIIVMMHLSLHFADQAHG